MPDGQTLDTPGLTPLSLVPPELPTNAAAVVTNSADLEPDSSSEWQAQVAASNAVGVTLVGKAGYYQNARASQHPDAQIGSAQQPFSVFHAPGAGLAAQQNSLYGTEVTPDGANVPLEFKFNLDASGKNGTFIVEDHNTGIPLTASGTVTNGVPQLGDSIEASTILGNVPTMTRSEAPSNFQQIDAAAANAYKEVLAGGSKPGDPTPQSVLVRATSGNSGQLESGLPQAAPATAVANQSSAARQGSATQSSSYENFLAREAAATGQSLPPRPATAAQVQTTSELQTIRNARVAQDSPGPGTTLATSNLATSTAGQPTTGSALPTKGAPAGVSGPAGASPSAPASASGAAFTPRTFASDSIPSPTDSINSLILCDSSGRLTPLSQGAFPAFGKTMAEHIGGGAQIGKSFDSHFSGVMGAFGKIQSQFNTDANNGVFSGGYTGRAVRALSSSVTSRGSSNSRTSFGEGNAVQRMQSALGDYKDKMKAYQDTKDMQSAAETKRLAEQGQLGHLADQGRSLQSAANKTLGLSSDHTYHGTGHLDKA